MVAAGSARLRTAEAATGAVMDLRITGSVCDGFGWDLRSDSLLSP